VSDITIHKNKNYVIKNLLRFRGRVTEVELQIVMNRLDKHIISKGAKRTGKLVTAIHVLYLQDRVSDIELFVAVDKEIASTKEFTFMPALQLESCLMVKYSGSTHLLPSIYTKLYYKAEELNLRILHPFYNVSNGGMNGLWFNTDVETDIYVQLI